MSVTAVKSNSSGTVLLTTPVVRETGIISDIADAYSRMAKSPVALTIFIFATIAIVAESNGQVGPFELLKTTLETYIADTKHAAFLITIANIILGVINFIIKNKASVFLLLLISVIPLTYPDRSTAFSVLFLIFYIFFSGHSQLILFTIIQLVFIYYSIQEFVWQLVDFVTITFVAFGTENVAKMFTKP